MQVSNFLKNMIWSVIFCIFCASQIACKKTIVENKVNDNVIYDVGTKTLYTSAADKNKQKTNAQFISILYADLFHSSIPNSQMNDLSILNSAFGDKAILNEILISNYMNTANVQLPTNSDMRNDIDAFIDKAFIRFYLRNPTATEKYFLKNLIEKDPNITPEHIYTAMAESNEYLFY